MIRKREAGYAYGEDEAAEGEGEGATFATDVLDVRDLEPWVELEDDRKISDFEERHLDGGPLGKSRPFDGVPTKQVASRGSVVSSR